MGWFGTRTYIGASWTVMAEVNGSRTWTELTATNPFPNTIALGVSFRDTTGADAGFFTIRSLPGFAQTKFLALRNLPVPNLTTGWFLLFSFPTPIVPTALVYWSDAVKNHTEVSNVPIEQLDGDGFPIGDADAQPRPTEMQTAQLGWHRPLATILSADVSDERARAMFEFFRATQSGPGSLDAAEPFMYVEGLLLDEEAAKFRSGVEEIPER
jgi:hypothetical protein